MPRPTCFSSILFPHVPWSVLLLLYDGWVHHIPRLVKTKDLFAKFVLSEPWFFVWKKSDSGKTTNLHDDCLGGSRVLNPFQRAQVLPGSLFLSCQHHGTFRYVHPANRHYVGVGERLRPLGKPHSSVTRLYHCNLCESIASGSVEYQGQDCCKGNLVDIASTSRQNLSHIPRLLMILLRGLDKHIKQYIDHRKVYIYLLSNRSSISPNPPRYFYEE